MIRQAARGGRSLALETTFKNGAYALTRQGNSDRVDVMDPELSALEEKLAQLVARLNALRDESRDLRQQVAARADENVRLAEKLAQARTRIEALLKQIPETES
jgi:uncharacterized protein (TIGR02449 family)